MLTLNVFKMLKIHKIAEAYKVIYRQLFEIFRTRLAVHLPTQPHHWFHLSPTLIQAGARQTGSGNSSFEASQRLFMFSVLTTKLHILVKFCLC